MPIWVSVKSMEQKQRASKSQICFCIKTPVNLYLAPQQTKKDMFTAV